MVNRSTGVWAVLYRNASLSKYNQRVPYVMDVQGQFWGGFIFLILSGCGKKWSVTTRNSGASCCA